MIPVNEPLLGQKESEYVTECLRTGWISSEGKFIREFEEKFAVHCGMKYGVAVSNGTTALQVAVRCLGLEPGDEVIMPTFTIISCALAILYEGGKPVLIDADPRTWTMDVTKIEEKITRRTKAIMAVHIYGHPCDMDPILDLADKYNLALIEDAAEAHGATYKGRKCGSLGDLTCFSFYANKIITTGEGGMVLTNSDEYRERVRSLRNLYFGKEKRFCHEELGFNFRMTNLQAAIGVAQLERMDELVAKKRWMGQIYTAALKDVAELRLPAEEPWAENVYWMYGVVLDESSGIDADEFGKRLKRRGIGTRPFFLGMHDQPIFQKRGLFKEEQYPIADRLAHQGLYLPSGLTLTEPQILQVCDSVRQCLQ